MSADPDPTANLVGYVIGSACGMIVGTVLGRSRFLAQLLDPFVMAFYSLPKVALAPVFILWLGIGFSMKVVLTAAIVFFLVFLNTYTGVRNVSRELEAILRLMGARERHVLLKDPRDCRGASGPHVGEFLVELVHEEGDNRPIRPRHSSQKTAPI